jgi:alpha,alpha-trehalase
MRSVFLLLALSVFLEARTQDPVTPDLLYGELFRDIQMNRIFPDSKTFVDMVPMRPVSGIMSDYRKIKKSPPPDFSLKRFVDENFTVPASQKKEYVTQVKDVREHIKALWPILKRNADAATEGSSLLPLPNPYIVPGGRFREIYYWDSYFTMLGLKESGETALIEDMINNFAYLIDTYGHVPNGNRTYYLSRSQPPFFSLMVELLAEIKGDGVFRKYLPALEKEYAYWMAGSEKITNGTAERRVVRMGDGSVLNRYWDDLDEPRQESYREDVETASKAVDALFAFKEFKNDRDREKAAEIQRRSVFRELRSAAASGWDFSSRWLDDEKKLTTIRTTNFIPVDLNCLIYQLEMTLRTAYLKAAGEKSDTRARYLDLAGQLERKASERKEAIGKFCWNESKGIYADHDFVGMKVSDRLHMGGMFPLYFQVADRARAGKHQLATFRELLKDGGFMTTSVFAGQQWDAPNGWAPLQWIAILGLEKYGYYEEARTAAERWVNLNRKVFERTGKLTEKYDVVNLDMEGGGGEYPNQDGFGWTNGVLLALINKFDL